MIQTSWMWKFQHSREGSSMYVINVAGKNLNYQWELYVPENVDVDKYIKDWLKAEYGIDDTYYITYGKMS